MCFTNALGSSQAYQLDKVKLNHHTCQLHHHFYSRNKALKVLACVSWLSGEKINWSIWGIISLSPGRIRCPWHKFFSFLVRCNSVGSVVMAQESKYPGSFSDLPTPSTWRRKFPSSSAKASYRVGGKPAAFLQWTPMDEVYIRSASFRSAGCKIDEHFQVDYPSWDWKTTWRPQVWHQETLELHVQRARLIKWLSGTWAIQADQMDGIEKPPLPTSLRSATSRYLLVLQRVQSTQKLPNQLTLLIITSSSQWGAVSVSFPITET